MNYLFILFLFVFVVGGACLSPFEEPAIFPIRKNLTCFKFCDTCYPPQAPKQLVGCQICFKRVIRYGQRDGIIKEYVNRGCLSFSQTMKKQWDLPQGGGGGDCHEVKEAGGESMSFGTPNRQFIQCLCDDANYCNGGRGLWTQSSGLIHLVLSTLLLLYRL